MFGIGKQNINSSSMTIFYLFVFLFVLNQFLSVHSFRLMHDDIDQQGTDDIRRALLRQMFFENYASPLEDASFNNQAIAIPVESSVQRRFCCMSPLSGRKRSIRDLTRQQIANDRA
ncbi:hypothetical protein I4U23_002648 [Adineta vaga]|nr:hypothetical protein I4U23_002648 [Adineta vaga]